MSKILITGAAGLLGQHLVKIISDDHTILAIDIADNPFEHTSNIHYLKADLTDFPAVRSSILLFKPEYIFNCAALTDVDRCETEKELADKLNFELVNHLLTIPFKKIIHYSSDYIFNGKSGPYIEHDSPEPINYYGITKLHSENILLNASVNYLIIRTNVVYGIAPGIKKNFITWVKESLENNEKISVVEDQFNNPIEASNLAEASIEAAFNTINGILHIAGNEHLSRYHTAYTIANYHNLDMSLIEKVKTSQIDQKAKRPLLGGLIIEKAKVTLKTNLLGFSEGYSLIAENFK